MILYFSDRNMNILGTAFSDKRGGNIVYNDKTVEETETGTTIFTCYIAYPEGKRHETEEIAKTGNYVFVASNDSDAMFYTIVNTEGNTEDRSISIYAESIGLELLNHTLDESTVQLEVPQSMSYYVEDILADTDFEKGTWETPYDEETSLEKKYILDFREQTALERLNTLMDTFDMEMYFTFKIEKMSVTHKYLNIFHRRGQNTYKSLTIGKEISNIRTTSSVENIATALKPTGDTPDGNLGILGEKNEHGRQTFVWLKFLGIDEEGQLYLNETPSGTVDICMAPVQWNQKESDNLGEYITHRFNYDRFIAVYPQSTGIEEITGEKDKTYAWIKFAKDEYGSGMSDAYSSSSLFIGIANGKKEAKKSDKPDDYKWYCIESNFGDYRFINLNSSGMPTESQLFIRYSAYSDGKSMTVKPSDSSKYVGYSFGRASSPTSPEAYEWVELEEVGKNGLYVVSPGVNTGIPFNGKYIHYIFSSEENGEKPTNAASGSYIGIRFSQQYPNPMSLNPASYIWSPISGTRLGAINLVGYVPPESDDDIYVENGIVRSREALKKWGRFTTDPNRSEHIIRAFNYPTLDYNELYKETVKELKKRRDPEVTYEVELRYIPDGIRIGDTVYIVDSEGSLYLSSRLVRLEKSYCDNTVTATLGDYKVRTSGIDEKLQQLKEQVEKQLENAKTYTWIVYADDANGAGISTDSRNKKWMGIATNRSKPVPDLTNPFIYAWSKIKSKEESYTVYNYGISADANTYPTEWENHDVSPTEEKPYLWSKGVRHFDDGSSEDIAPHVIGVFGRGIASVVSWYGTSNSTTVEPKRYVISPIPVITAENKYLWTYVVTTYTDGKKVETEHHIVGSYGEDGVTIISDLIYYAQTDTTTTPTSSEWILCPPGSIPVITSDHPYLWSKEDITYSDGKTKNVAAHIIGVYGKSGKDGKDGAKGDKGDPGEKGDKGRSIISHKTQYALSTIKTDPGPTSGWKDAPPAYNQSTAYVYWIRTVTTWSEEPITEIGKAVIDWGLTTSNQNAKNAQTSADGKNTVFYQENEPVGNKDGDIWYKIFASYEDGNSSGEMYTFKDGKWVKFELDDSAIHSINAQKINAGELDASKVNVVNLNASNITTGNMSANRITTGILQDKSGKNLIDLDSGTVKLEHYSTTDDVKTAISSSENGIRVSINDTKSELKGDISKTNENVAANKNQIDKYNTYFDFTGSGLVLGNKEDGSGLRSIYGSADVQFQFNKDTKAWVGIDGFGTNQILMGPKGASANSMNWVVTVADNSSHFRIYRLL